MVKTTVSPPYGLVLVESPSGGDLPQTIAGLVIAATETCIAIGCRADVDGPTEIVLGSRAEADPGTEAAYRGTLSTSTPQVAVRSVDGTNFLELQTRGTEHRVSVWLNDAREPDVIRIGVEAVDDV